jgi:hypothetical protein
VFSAVGDTVAEDEVVCEIETDKVGLFCISDNFSWSFLSFFFFFLAVLDFELRA